MQSQKPLISVLLVDDQKFVGTAVERLLAGEEDIQLHQCDKAFEAVDRANQIRPTVILQDLVLPDIDGVTMVRLFRANPTTASTAIIVTGRVAAERHIEMPTACGLIPKTVSLTRLVEVLVPMAIAAAAAQ